MGFPRCSQCPVSTDDLFPLRLLVSLLDKPEIGPPIIEDLLVDVFRSVVITLFIFESAKAFAVGCRFYVHLLFCWACVLCKTQSGKQS